MIEKVKISQMPGLPEQADTAQAQLPVIYDGSNYKLPLSTIITPTIDPATQVSYTITQTDLINKFAKIDLNQKTNLVLSTYNNTPIPQNFALRFINYKNEPFFIFLKSDTQGQTKIEKNDLTQVQVITEKVKAGFYILIDPADDWFYVAGQIANNFISENGSIIIFTDPATNTTNLEVYDPVPKVYVWDEEQFDPASIYLNERGGGQMLICSQIIFTRNHDVDVKNINIIGYVPNASIVFQNYHLHTPGRVIFKDLSIHKALNWGQDKYNNNPVVLIDRIPNYSSFEAYNCSFHLLKPERVIAQIHCDDDGSAPLFSLNDCFFGSLQNIQEGTPIFNVTGETISQINVSVNSDKSREEFQKTITINYNGKFSFDYNDWGYVSFAGDGSVNILWNLAEQPPKGIKQTNIKWLAGLYLPEAKNTSVKQPLGIDPATNKVGIINEDLNPIDTKLLFNDTYLVHITKFDEDTFYVCRQGEGMFKYIKSTNTLTPTNITNGNYGYSIKVGDRLYIMSKTATEGIKVLNNNTGNFDTVLNNACRTCISVYNGYTYFITTTGSIYKTYKSIADFIFVGNLNVDSANVLEWNKKLYVTTENAIFRYGVKVFDLTTETISNTNITTENIKQGIVYNNEVYFSGANGVFKLKTANELEHIINLPNSGLSLCIEFDKNLYILKNSTGNCNVVKFHEDNTYEVLNFNFNIVGSAAITKVLTSNNYLYIYSAGYIHVYTKNNELITSIIPRVVNSSSLHKIDNIIYLCEYNKGLHEIIEIVYGKIKNDYVNLNQTFISISDFKALEQRIKALENSI